MYNEEQLITQQEVRKQMVEREDVFNNPKVKALGSFLLPKDFGATTQMVANYFEVDKKTLEKVIERNSEELKENGMVLETKENLLTYNMSVKTKRGGFDVLDETGNILFSGSNKGVVLLSRRTILNVAMLLRDSQVAKQIRNILLDATENKTVLNEILNDNQEEFKNLLLDIWNGGEQGIVASKKITAMEVEKATKPLLNQLEEQQPMVDLAQTVIAVNERRNTGCMTVSQLAKIISTHNNKGLTFSNQNLYTILRDQKLIMKGKTEPYQSAIDRGLFKQYHEQLDNGMVVYTTYVTAKGQKVIMDLIKKLYHNFHPELEELEYNF